VAWHPVRIAAVDIARVHAQIDEPVRGAFGAMTSRVSVLVRVRDTSGAEGYGEIWSNFPEGGAAYKQQVARHYVTPLLVNRTFDRPWDAWDLLDVHLSRLALQSGDFGTFAQVCAGVDQAMWDLFCHRAAAPLWRLAGGVATVPVYASGIGPDRVDEVIAAQAQAGHTRFKIKLGFDPAVDDRKLKLALDALPGGGNLYTDANQAWDVAQAKVRLRELEALGIEWCEEPVPADTVDEDWCALTASVERLRIAAGENVRGLDALAALCHRGGVGVIQPDLGKWGGVTGALRLHSRLPADAWLCPHWLAGAVGLAASLQLAGAIGGRAPVELDANPNPLRTNMLVQDVVASEGNVRLSDSSGIVPRLRSGIAWE